MANTSPTVLLRRRSYANPGTGVIVWPLQCPAILLTSVLAAMARTALQVCPADKPNKLSLSSKRSPDSPLPRSSSKSLRV